jgi:hypothetical protein
MVWYGMGFSNTIPYHGPAYTIHVEAEVWRAARHKQARVP